MCTIDDPTLVCIHCVIRITFALYGTSSFCLLDPSCVSADNPARSVGEAKFEPASDDAKLVREELSMAGWKEPQAVWKLPCTEGERLGCGEAMDEKEL